MPLLEDTQRKLAAFQAKVRDVASTTFPYPEAEAALRVIEDKVQERLDSLTRLSGSSSRETVVESCRTAVQIIPIYLPIVGFCLRSKNINNPLEAYWPLLRLSRQLAGEGCQLILSSEWQFSPYTYLQVPYLTDYVLIGLPASESSNALLLPLAGHELGHTLWAKEKCSNTYRPHVYAKVIDLFLARWDDFQQYETSLKEEEFEGSLLGLKYYQAPIDWALRQLEEVFCDVIGLRLFGAAYLHAFAYFLAPGDPAARSRHYPHLAQRAQYLALAAAKFKVSLPTSFVDQFEEENAGNQGLDSFQIAIADEACSQLVADVIAQVNRLGEDRSLPDPSGEEVETVVENFRLLVPARSPTSASQVLNAGWKAHARTDLWSEYEQIQDDRDRVLNELILKSLEALEVSARRDG